MLRTACAAGLVLLAVVASINGRSPLAVSLLAAIVIALPPAGYLAPRLGPRFALPIAILAVLPFKWVSWSPEYPLEPWMSEMERLPFWLLGLVLTISVAAVVRPISRPLVHRVPRTVIVGAVTVMTTALPAWGLTHALAEGLFDFSHLALYATGPAAWVLAVKGLLCAGGHMHGADLRVAGPVLLAAALVSAPTVVAWCLSTEMGDVGGFDETPYAMAHRLRRDLADFYPHWDTAPLTIDELWESRRDKLWNEAVSCEHGGIEPDEPCVGLLRVLQDMFAVLQNGHTGVLVNADLGYTDVGLRPVADGVVIDWVLEGSEAERFGLKKGMEVVGVNGLTVEEAARRSPAWTAANVSDRTRDYNARQSVTTGIPGSTVSLTVEDRAGSRRTVELTRIAAYDHQEGEAAGDEEDEEAWIEGFLVGESFGYIRWDSFEGSELVEKFDRMVDDALQTGGLILDLRDNGGGDVDVARQIIGRFFAERVQLSVDCTRAYDSYGEFQKCEKTWVEPRAPTFTKALAVLIDTESWSAAEVVAYALCRIGNAKCFGQATAGESDYVEKTPVPGGEVRLSCWDFRPTVGSPILGVGVEPHEKIPLTIADVRAGRDPVYQAARRWLFGKQGR